jgi:hypothetical protein
MNRNIHIENELKNLSSRVAEIPVQHTFTVPEKYFEGLEQSIISRIRLEEGIISAADEIQQLSPALAQIKQKNTYTVDSDFFDKKSATLAEISKKKPAHVVHFQLRKLAYKIAIAASFVVLVGLALLKAYQPNSQVDLVKQGLALQTDDQFNEYLAKLDTDEILTYLKHHSLPSDKEHIGSMIDAASLPGEDAYFDETFLDTLLITN